MPSASRTLADDLGLAEARVHPPGADGAGQDAVRRPSGALSPSRGSGRRCGGVEGEDAPGTGPEGFLDRVALQLPATGDTEHGEDEHPALHRYGVEYLVRLRMTASG